MSRPRSDASPTPTPTKHRSGFIRVLSTFSKPVDEWGVSSVPVLSTSVTPRRERAPATRSRRGSNSGRSTTSSPSRLDSVNVFESPSRVPPIRPLSVATVSTFGGWMQERVEDEDEAEDGSTSKSAALMTREHSEDTQNQHSQPATPIQHKDTVPNYWKSPSADRSESSLCGHGSSIYPLRMHPPSPPPSFSAPSISPEDQRTSLTPQSPRKLPQPSPPLFDDAASKASRGTISTRRSRRTLPALNIDTANSAISPHDEDVQHKDDRQAGAIEADALPTGRHASFPRDVGYVAAMRLWYEEKENDASETRQRERKAARRVGTAGCALASVGANQRL